MKQAGLAIAMLIVGFLLGSVTVDDSVVEEALQRGRSEATVAMQQQAVREGHGRWEYCADGSAPSLFAWIPRHPEWRGDHAAAELIIGSKTFLSGSSNATPPGENRGRRMMECSEKR